MNFRYLFLFLGIRLIPLGGQVSSIQVDSAYCTNDSLDFGNGASYGNTWRWTYANTTGLHNDPKFKNLGNPSNSLSSGSFMCSVIENGNCYIFITNYDGSLTRLEFGGSFSNDNPKGVPLGTLGGKLPRELEGIQMIKEDGKWYGFVVGGQSGSKMIRLDFGTSITSTPTTTDLGNLGGMGWPHNLSMFNYKGTWYGFVANRNSSSFSRIEFGNKISNTPVGYNVKIPGVKNGLTDFKIVKDDEDTFHIFTAELLGKKFIQVILGKDPTNNNPTFINHGNLSNAMNVARGIVILKDCDGWVGYLNDEASRVIRFDFPNGITGKVTSKNLGDVCKINSRYSDFCRPIRWRDTVYSFLTHPDKNTFSRATWPLTVSNKWHGEETQKIPTHFIGSNPGSFPLIVSMDEFEPTQEDTCLMVKIKSCCDVIISGSRKICTKQNSILMANFSTVVDTVIWYLDDMLLAGKHADSLVINKAGKYVVLGYGKNCSLATDSFWVTLDSLKLNPDFNGALCKGDSILLTPGNAASYQWFPSKGLQNGTIGSQYSKPSTSVIYTCIGTIPGGCRDTFVAYLLLYPDPIPSLPDTALLCSGKNVILDAGNNSFSLWNGKDTGRFHTVLSSGKVIWFGRDVNACPMRDTVDIKEHSSPFLFVQSDTTLCKGMSFPYFVNSSNWNTKFVFSGPSGWSSANTTVISGGQYTITAQNPCGTSTVSFKVNISSCDTCDLWLPNAFTPDANGHNDKFALVSYCEIISSTTRIYSRWGEQLAESTDIHFEWDGNYLGEPCQEGVYVAVVDMKVFVGGMLSHRSIAKTIHLLR